MARRTRPRPGRAPLEPYDVDGVATVALGTVAWAVAFVVLLSVRDRLAAAGASWWLWTCLVGALLGVLGVLLCRRRRDAGRQAPEISPDG